MLDFLQVLCYNMTETVPQKEASAMSKRSSRNTKGRIVSAAWKLFYEQGYDDTTIEEIVESAVAGVEIVA